MSNTMRAVVLDAPGPPEALVGVVCFTGMVSNQWTVPDFYPIEYCPAACA